MIWYILMVIIGLAINSHRHNIRAMPAWIGILWILMMLSYHPTALVVQLTILFFVWHNAMTLDSLVAIGFALYAMCAFIYFTVGPANWALIRRR